MPTPSRPELVAELLRGASQAAERYKEAYPYAAENTKKEIMVAYLSGCSQTTNYLVRNDGAVTPQMLDAAMPAVAMTLGIGFGPAKQSEEKEKHQQG